MLACGAAFDVGHANVTPYAVLIRACGKELAVEKAFKVLRCMLNAGIKPNVVTFNSLIEVSAKCVDLPRALRVLDLMPKYECSPDAVSYTALIDLSCRTLEVERAFELIGQFKQQVGGHIGGSGAWGGMQLPRSSATCHMTCT